LHEDHQSPSIWELKKLGMGHMKKQPKNWKNLWISKQKKAFFLKKTENIGMGQIE
jgi:hypothetical protein